MQPLQQFNFISNAFHNFGRFALEGNDRSKDIKSAVATVLETCKIEYSGCNKHDNSTCFGKFTVGANAIKPPLNVKIISRPHDGQYASLGTQTFAAL